MHSHPLSLLYQLFKWAFQHLSPLNWRCSGKGLCLKGSNIRPKYYKFISCFNKLALYCLWCSLTWHKTPVPKQMSWYFDCCIPSQPSAQRMLKSTQNIKKSSQKIFNYKFWNFMIELSFVPLLTVLDHADEGDDDQEVDVFHHFHIHDVCVSCSRRRMTKRPRESPSVS